MKIIEISLCIIGCAGVGKTCIVKQFTNPSSNLYPVIPTIGSEFVTKIYESSNKQIKLSLYDTGGMETFKSLTPNFIRRSDVCILVYDITNIKSFEAIRNEYLKFVKEVKSSICLYLVGNKQDLEKNRTVDFTVVDQFAMDNNITFMEASAKKRNNIDSLFKRIAYDFIMKMVEMEVTMGTEKIERNESNEIVLSPPNPEIKQNSCLNSC